MVWVLVGLLSPACLTPTEIGIEVDLDAELRAQAETLIVTSAGPLEFAESERIAVADFDFPVTKYIVPRGGDAGRTFRVDFELLDAAGETLLTRRVVGGYEERALRTIRILLSGDCMGVECGAGRSCAGGRCRPVCYDERVGPTSLSEPQECGSECAALDELSPCVVADESGACRAGTCCTGCWDPDDNSCHGGDVLDACGGGGRICNGCCPGESCGTAGCSPPENPIAWMDANDEHTCVGTEAASYCFGANTQALRVDGAVPPLLREPQPLGLVGRVDTGNRGSCAAGDPGVDCREAPSPNRPLGRGLGTLNSTVLSHISVGNNHACGIRNGELICWGENTHGQLGLEELAAVRGPNPVEDQGPPTWVDVQASHNLTCGIREEGSWWCWGRRSDWLDPVNASRSGEDHALVQIQGPDGIRFERLAVSRRGSCAIGSDEALYCVGRMVDEALSCDEGGTPAGLTATMLREGPLLDFGITEQSVCILRDAEAEVQVECRGTVTLIGERVPNACEFVPYENGGAFSQVAIGRDHGCMTRRDGTLYCFGSNRLGQVAKAEDVDRVPHPRRVCLP